MAKVCNTWRHSKNFNGKKTNKIPKTTKIKKKPKTAEKTVKLGH